MKRTFFLTGCASGIGRRLAEALLSAGHRVAATDIDREALRARALDWPSDRGLALGLDVRDARQWEDRMLEARRRLGDIDVVMNIAGYLSSGWAHEMPPAEVDKHFDINVKGVIFGTQTAARFMLARGRGHIVNIASMAALAPIPGLAFYSASKYAVRSFSLAAAQELRPHGIDVTVVCPDAVRTPMLDRQRGSAAAALTFSGGGPLTVDDMARVMVERVLPHRPLEVFLPAGRGWLARLADVFPRVQAALYPVLQRRGLARQARHAE